VGYYLGPRTAKPGFVGPQRELLAREVGSEWQELEIYAPLTGARAGAVRIDDENLAIRAKEIADYPEEAPGVAIWRLEWKCVR
jgi:hypothetical protein